MSFSITPYHNVDGSYVDDLLRMDMCENILLELRSGGDHGMYVYPKFLRDLASGQVFTPRQCGLGRAGQCGFHTRGR